MQEIRREGKGIRRIEGVNPRLHTMQQVYEKFSLDKKTIDFVGHADGLV